MLYLFHKLLLSEYIMKKSSYYELTQDSRQDLGIIFNLEETSYPSHFHKKPEITYMTNGNCTSVINQTEYFTEKDDILYVPEYYPHSYTTSDDAKRIVFIPVPEHKTDVDNLLNTKTFPCLLDDKVYNRTKILPCLNDLLTVQNDKTIETTAKIMLLKGYTGIFYGRLYDRYGDCLVERKKQIESLTNILIYLEKNYKSDVTLDALSDKFGYNRYYFSKLFNSCVGENLKNYVNNIRVKKFTEIYAEDTSANITNLALTLGFDSMPSFYRAFKRLYHCSPKEFFTPPRKKNE